jgi:hypothetical protein
MRSHSEPAGFGNPAGFFIPLRKPYYGLQVMIGLPEQEAAPEAHSLKLMQLQPSGLLVGGHDTQAVSHQQEESVVQVG